MIIYIKKIKTKEGINSIDLEKIAKEVPAGYKVTDKAPAITYTANHMVLAYTCQAVAKVQKKAVVKAKPKAKKA